MAARSISGRTGRAGSKSGVCLRREARRRRSPGGGLAAIESDDGFIYYSKDAQSPTSIWRVPVEGGSEVPLVDGLSYSLNFAVSRQGLYFIALNGTPDQASVDFFDFSTRQRSTLVRLDKRFWLGITLSPDEQSLVFPLVDSAGSHLMLVDSFR